MIKAPFGAERAMVCVLEMATDEEDIPGALIGDSNSRDISENEVLQRRVSYSSLRMSHGTFEGEKATSFHLNHCRKQTVQLWGKFKEHVINELVPQV